MWKEAFPDEYAAAVAPQPFKRLRDTIKDIAPVVMFLVSDDVQFVTGENIGVDGGTTMLS
ncbi:SDR family oxidoreductase [Paenibacillus polymyxa]|uniref:SDR family oxidoreductase n=1 Tax=Paenibacillus polymyxa TaxID=1406 RepID=UPI002AB5D94F|nr:SDR family oxidoreductase [Paenibacillus polymyxa]MDY8023271.1 SDR family oxidoreductase [Paenibacillus polymyxa]